MDTKFTIEYDHRPDQIVDIISGVIQQFGLKIIEVEGFDGFVDYEIIKIDIDEK
jgi:hypothetical protein